MKYAIKRLNYGQGARQIYYSGHDLSGWKQWNGDIDEALLFDDKAKASECVEEHKLTCNRPLEDTGPIEVVPVLIVETVE